MISATKLDVADSDPNQYQFRGKLIPFPDLPLAGGVRMLSAGAGQSSDGDMGGLLLSLIWFTGSPVQVGGGIRGGGPQIYFPFAGLTGDHQE